jgi:hypothetical protein
MTSPPWSPSDSRNARESLALEDFTAAVISLHG